MTDLAVAALLAVLVLLGAVSDARPTPVARTAPRSVVLFGDSLAVGLNPHFRALAVAAGVPYAADVKGGTDCGYWLGTGRAERLLREHRPALAMISLGTNDNYVPGPAAVTRAATFARRARELTALCNKYGARAVWLIPPPMPRGSKDTAAGILGTADLGSFRIEPPPNLERASDRIHCTPKGYQQWARSAWSLLP